MTLENKKFLIDFGHTFCKVALFSDSKIRAIERYDNSSNLILDIEKLILNHDCKDIVCSSVLPKYSEAFLNKSFSKLENFNIKFFNINDSLTFITPAYKDNLNRLGVDRALNLIGARQRTEDDLIVIDAGTATTIDYLDKNNVHHGGTILPSKDLIVDSFKDMLDFDFSNEKISENLFSDNTASSINRGAELSAYIGVEKFIDEIIMHFNSNPIIFVTGGAYLDVIHNCNYELKHVESLIFECLLVYDKGM